MKLTQQGSGGAAENLLIGNDTMTTGAMGDCVSIIVLWDFQGERAINVRGFHGSGGFEAINLVSLFKNVPNDGQTLIHCFYGFLAQAGSDLAKATAEIAHLRPLAVTTHHNMSNASVTRANVVTAAVGAPILRKKMCVIL